MLKPFEIRKAFSLDQNPNTAKPTFEVVDTRGRVKFESKSVRACTQWIKNYNNSLYGGKK
jgi:hypothetical protein